MPSILTQYLEREVLFICQFLHQDNKQVVYFYEAIAYLYKARCIKYTSTEIGLLKETRN